MTVGGQGQTWSSVLGRNPSTMPPATSAGKITHHAWSGRATASSSGTVWAMASVPAGPPLSP
ncbi:hypothetical protein SRIMM317S_06006 [Streptomyces rimosus subsp. rimosus]